MRYRKLHGTDREISELGFGTWTVTTGWWGTYTDAEAERLIREGIDTGINYIDTADAYGNGRGETILAPILADHPDLLVGTKFGYDFYNNPVRPRGQRELPQDFSVEFIRFALEQSLTRLGTECIAIYQPHNPRLATLLQDEYWELMDRLVEEGKILAHGPSLGPAIGWRDEGIYSTGARKAPVTQMIYNMIEQDPGREFIFAAETAQRGEKYEGIADAVRGETNRHVCEPSSSFDSGFLPWRTPALAEDGPQFLIRVTHSSGMLEGKYTLETTFDESDHRSHRPRSWMVEGVQKVARIRELAEGRGVTVGQLALLWLYSHPSVLSALPNIYGTEQIEEFAAASQAPLLSEEEMEWVDQQYGRNFDITPYVEEAEQALAGTKRQG